MIELELFYKIVESEIRRKHIKYLKNQKCLPSDFYTAIPIDLSIQDKKSKVLVEQTEQLDEFVYSDNPKRREIVKRVKAFNKGIETALKVLINDYKRFNKRFENDE